MMPSASPEPAGTPDAPHRKPIPVPKGSGVVQHAAWLERRFPDVEDLGGGTFSIPVPFPGNPLRYTLSYLLTGDGAAVVVDPGWNSDEGADALFAGLAECGVEPSAVTGVLVTHVHPDHHGLSGRLAAASGAWIGMHADDAALLTAAGDTVARRAGDAPWLRRNGVPESDVPGLTYTGRADDLFPTMAHASRALADGELVDLPGRRVRAVWTPGHTPGHLCFHDEDADRLLTGDHLLPRISPNIGTHPGDHDPPLARYLQSLRRLRSYDSAEALPAHEWRFEGVAARADQLLAHHQERCDEVLAVLADGPKSAWDTASVLTWSRGWSGIHGLMRRSALAETLSHLVYLVGNGALVQVPAGADGVIRYAITTRPAPAEHHRG
jgi:glyoxylase-like metal-dependent hydrolase (beta-lactamase superfamily II)